MMTHHSARTHRECPYIHELADRFSFVILLIALTISSATQCWAELPMVLELGQITVNETKPNGKRWDFGLGKISKPDLVITVSLDDEQLLTTKKCKDSFSCELTRSAPFMLRGEQTLRFKVVDKDLKRDDAVDLLTVSLNERESNQKRALKLAGKSTSMLSFTVRPFIGTNATATPNAPRGELASPASESKPEAEPESESPTPSASPK